MRRREGFLRQTEQILPGELELYSMDQEMQRAFPHAQVSILINRRSPVVGGEPKVNSLRFGRFTRDGKELPVFLASTSKPIHIAAAAEYATKHEIRPEADVWTITTSGDLVLEYYEDIYGIPAHPESAPSTHYIKDIIEPLVGDDFITFRDRLAKAETVNQSNVNELQVLVDQIKNKPEQTIAQGLLFEHMKRKNVDLFTSFEDDNKKVINELNSGAVLGKTSLHKLIVAGLGPSSNVAIMAISRSLGEMEGKLGPDVIQDYVHRMLGNKVLLTMNNSSKEKSNKYWNVGKQSELLRLFSMILDGDKRLGISEEYLQEMQFPLEKYHADPGLEMADRFKELNNEIIVYEKSGYFNLDTDPKGYNSMPRFMRVNHWKGLPFEKVAIIGNIIRIVYPDGTIIDMATSISFPHKMQDNDQDQAQKMKAAYIVMNTLVRLLS